MNADQSPGPWCPRVVVAEDDAPMRELVADVVRREGCEVEELTDGEQLLVRVVTALVPRHQASRIDLIISDVRMPFCSGLDILKKLRFVRRTTPVILMTAFGDPWLRRTRMERDRGEPRAEVERLVDPGSPQRFRGAVIDKNRSGARVARAEERKPRADA